MDYDATDYDLMPNLQDTLEFEDNPDQRTPCVLLLDNSYSMQGTPINELAARIDMDRGDVGLASAIRVWVLEQVKTPN